MFGVIKKIYSRTILANIYPHNLIRKDYYFSCKDKRPMSAVIFLMDSRYRTMGFADCLRGIISAYAFAKAKGLPFKIDFRTPFCLTDYLVPNKYDWTVDESVISYNYKYTSPLWVMDYDKGNIFYLPFPRSRQYHFYTNVNILNILNKKYNQNYEYKLLYEELFRPSESLRNSIEEIENVVGNDYISASFRFSTLLGDFEDCINNPLTLTEQQEYIVRCKQKLEDIYSENNKKRVFVTSDSKKFIEAMKGIPWVTVVDGQRSRFSNTSETNAHLLTFIDYFIISHARKAYMLYTGKMYRSNFAKSAAMTTGIPYEEVAF